MTGRVGSVRFQGVSTSVVLVPGAPVLVPELAGAAAADSACAVSATLRMLRSAASGVSRVLVLGTDTEGRTLGEVRTTLDRWGVAVPVGDPSAPAAGHDEVPGPALLGWWFLDRGGITVPRAFVGIPGDGESTPEAGSDTLVVVVADGPASLTPRAPVPEDPRGVALDAALTDWLRNGGHPPDPGQEVADAVGWWSRPAWLALAALVADRPAVETLSWAPFGVGYHGARWDLSSSDVETPGGSA